MATRDRLELTDLLAGLSPAQWQEPTLCDGWSVRDVVAHIFSYEVIGWPATARRMILGLRHEGGPNGQGLDFMRDRASSDLLEIVREIPLLLAIGGRGVALADLTGPGMNRFSVAVMRP